MERRAFSLAIVVTLAATLFVLASILGQLGHPLLWHDESETAMFGTRVLEYGYPKVHGERNVIYSLWHANGVGIDETTDAYTGSPWVQYYVSALGVALGQASEDLYTRTAWVRAPFALAGIAGLLWLALLAWPLLGSSRQSRMVGIAAYAAILAYSVNLLVHLREARYYGLVMLAIAAILALWQRRDAKGGFSRRSEILLILTFVALFHTFHPAFGALGLGLALVAAGEAWRRENGMNAQTRRFLRTTRPLLLAAGLAFPALLFFDFIAQTEGWLERFADPLTPLRNLSFVGWTLARYEFGVAALVLRLAVVLCVPRDPSSERRQFAAALASVILVYALAIAQIPFLFERYFVVLGPLVTLMGILDARTLWESAHAPSALRMRAARGLALGALAFASAFVARLPEFRAHASSFGQTYQGPLDFVIPHLLARYEEPSDLVIATNYEGPAYMFYLGSHVTVGFYGASLDVDREIQPDVIVPRPWPDHIELLRELSQRVEYAPVHFPVENLPWNNNPALSPRRDHPTAHRFKTPVPRGGAPALVILERVSPDNRRVEPEAAR